MDTESIKRAILQGHLRRDNKEMSTELLSTGSTLLNLAVAGDWRGGIPAGRYVFFVGDSSSGKTFLALTCLAESRLSDHFRSYRLIFDNAEDGALMDMERFFGRRLREALEPPAVHGGKPIYSTTVEDFYFHLDDAFTAAKKEGRPFIYVLDSMDALSSEFEGKKFGERKVALRSGRRAKGDYGDGKAKINSGWIRRARAELRDTGSILIIICQTRDYLGDDLFGPSYVYSGGRALRFYADVEILTTIGAKIKKDVHGKKRQIGIYARCQVEKNRITGKEWSIKVPIYWSYGIDDVGSCVDFLVEEKRWKKSSNGIIDGSGDLKGCVGRREKVIWHIEKEGLVEDVRELVAETWAEVEEACKVKRVPRYD